jgi:hypothetical protein
MQNVTLTPPKNKSVVNAFGNPTAIGSNAFVAAQAGRSIRVVGLAIDTVGANTVSFLSNATPITPNFSLAATAVLVLPFSEHGWMETAVGEALNVNLTAATAVGVLIQYIVI